MPLWDDYVYHYTGARALLSIVTGRQLWASSTGFLNDQFEGALPIRMITRMLQMPDKQLKGIARPPDKHLEALGISLQHGTNAVATSFSQHSHSLPQFRMYAPPAGGFAIGFPRDFLSRVATLVECDYSNENLRSWCLSHAKEFFEHAARMDDGSMPALALSNAIGATTDLIRKRLDAGLRFKSEEFNNEREVRLCEFVPWTKFRASRDDSYLIPYHVLELPNEPIQVLIVVGPNRDPVLAQQVPVNLIYAAKEAKTEWMIGHRGSGEFGFRGW